MNKVSLVGGIIYLVLAALLGVLNVALPADLLLYPVGDADIPWFTTVILGVVGIVLLVTTGSCRQNAET